MVGKDRHKVPEGTASSAAMWFARMRSEERTAADEQRFRKWLEAAPEHEAAYAGLQRTFEGVGAFAEAPEVRDLRAATLRRPRPALRAFSDAPVRAMGVALALAACLVLAVFAFHAGLPWPDAAETGVYQTAAGERSNVVLDDGTLVTLTSNSRLVEDFSPERRRVRLERGQAYFDVMSDAERPFVVEAGGGAITALGTIFDICRDNGDVVVTLVEGAIEVAALEPAGLADRAQDSSKDAVRLKAGEQVSYGMGRLSQVREVDTARAVSWRHGLLLIEERPFVEAVNEFNRHSRYKLLLDNRDSRLRKVRISGAFRIDHPERLAAHLKDQGFTVSTMKDSAGNVRLTVYGKTSGD